ncbi:MAG: 16S rRNA (guanine(527)-N(7))-methyltransferase RsmG [Peptococcaceae bacterium]|nr:16S rRNA (guanine(527)-N(7))-methyltransferase RsmG [Peptococcaceae bacterium]
MDNTLRRGAESLGLSLSNSQVASFLKYLELIVEWNKKFNLTAITDPNEIIVKHFLDSLLMAPYIQPDALLADVGTGAGFPGIPLKILFPSVKLTLVDSLAKRVVFLQEVCRELNLTEVSALHGRVEDIGRLSSHRARYDIVVTRAVAKMSVICEYCLPLLRISGKFIAAKGPSVNPEIEAAQNAIKLLGGRLIEVKTTSLPARDDLRTIVIIDKVNLTPMEYPRKAGIPGKSPL